MWERSYEIAFCIKVGPTRAIDGSRVKSSRRRLFLFFLVLLFFFFFFIGLRCGRGRRVASDVIAPRTRSSTNHHPPTKKVDEEDEEEENERSKLIKTGYQWLCEQNNRLRSFARRRRRPKLLLPAVGSWQQTKWKEEEMYKIFCFVSMMLHPRLSSTSSLPSRRKTSCIKEKCKKKKEKERRRAMATG